MKKENSKNKSSNSILRFSGMAFSMVVIVGLFVWLGVWLDSKSKSEFPIWTVVLLFVGASVSIVQVVRELTKK